VIAGELATNGRLVADRLEVIRGAERSDANEEPVQVFAERLQFTRADRQRCRHVAGKGHPHRAGEAGDRRSDAAADVIGMLAAVERDLEVVHRTDRHRVPRARDAPVVGDDGDDDSPAGRLAEFERVRVAGIGVTFAVACDVIVTEERMRDSGGLQFGGVERRVRLLPRLLEGECSALRGVRQCQVDAAAIGGEAREEAIGVGRGAVGGAPQGQPIGQGERGETVLGEEVHVRRPRCQRVRAAGRIPVVVTRGEVDGPIGPREARAQELDGVGGEAVVLEQVAGTQDRVDRLRICQLEDSRQRLAPVLASPPGHRGAGPGEGRVKMEVGEMQEFHGSQA